MKLKINKRNIPIEFVSNEVMADRYGDDELEFCGLYDGLTGTIYINECLGKSLVKDTLVHEAVHALIHHKYNFTRTTNIKPKYEEEYVADLITACVDDIVSIEKQVNDVVSKHL